MNAATIPDETYGQARACVRCMKVKPARRFPPIGMPRRRRGAPKAPGITRVCWTCIEAEAHARNSRKRQVVRTKRTERGRVRECKGCSRVLPLTRRHFYPKEGTFFQLCKKCSKARAAEHRQRRMKDPAFKARENARKRELRQDPERRRAANEAQLRYRAKVRADPEKHRRAAEDRRIAYRLKREREGKGVRDPKSHISKVLRIDEVRRIPAAPIAALITGLRETRKQLARQLGDPTIANVRELCQDLGVDERQYRAWMCGEIKLVSVGVAERVMLAADVDPTDVYADYPDALAQFRTEDT